ncbi:MAG: acyl-CoA thioesterase [Paracoccaceae bacterium]
MLKTADDETFTYRVRVKWGDCDPARIAYTGRIPIWALEAIEAWWEHNAALDWYALNVDRGIGTPFVHMTLDFRAPITPRHSLVCTVRLVRLGTKSIRHRVEGFQDGGLCFEGEFVSAFVDTNSFVARELPGELRRVFEKLSQDPVICKE